MTIPRADDFRLETLARVERLKLQKRQLLRTVDMIEDEIESEIEVSVRLGIETLPVEDAHPEVVAIARGELARALLSVRRAGRCCVRIGLDTEALSVAAKHITDTGRQLPPRRGYGA